MELIPGPFLFNYRNYESHFFFLSKNGTVPTTDAVTREINILKSIICLILSMNSSTGSASSLILIPGIPKQMNKYAATNVIKNNMADKACNLSFVLSFWMSKGDEGDRRPNREGKRNHSCG